MAIRDAQEIVKLAAFTLIAWLLPPRLWRKAAAATCKIGKDDNWNSAWRNILGNKYSDAHIARISARHHAYIRELKLQILGLNGPWRSWRPDIWLHGMPHLQNALARERGAILWVVETAFSTLIAKMALHDAGIHCCQLSRPGHGFSPSDFCARYLNPLWQRTEDRFTAERVLIKGETAAEALAVLRARLAANGVVNITLVPQAHRFAHVPFFRTRLRLPTGPIRLARTTGAPLLPVFTVARDDGGYDVSIDAPLPAGVSDERVAAALAKRLEPFVAAHPDQWAGWGRPFSLPSAAPSRAGMPREAANA
jgi:lauroyl/myristoyl acyltransferase